MVTLAQGLVDHTLSTHVLGDGVKAKDSAKADLGKSMERSTMVE